MVGTSVRQVRRLCERPGCSAPADVSYGIDKVGLTVWVDNRAVPEREHAGRLCRRHANALTVPRGWTLDDRREAIPRLFKALAEEVAAKETPSKRTTRTKRKEPSVVVEPPTLFEAPKVNTAVEVGAVADVSLQDETVTPLAVDPDETQAIPWSPRLSSSASADDDDDAPVFGRLLGRAFGQKNSSDGSDS